MRVGFIDANFKDNIPLYKIGDVSLVERLIKTISLKVEKVYILVNEDNYFYYKDNIKGSCDYILCEHHDDILENVKGYYDNEDDVMFASGNVIIEDIDECFELYAANSSIKYFGDTKDAICICKGGKLKNIDSFCVINSLLKSSIHLVDKNNYPKISMDFNKCICKKHLCNDVNILDVNNTYIGENVTIGRGTIIYPGNCIYGKTVIGDNVILYPNNFIIDSSIGDYCKIGPFSNLKKFSDIKENVEVGAFVEVKNSCLKSGVKAKHHAYIGDVDIKEKCNIGAGVIFANYDGAKKHRTIVEKGSFIGSNVTIVSPVKIGKKAFIAAGSTIVKDVESRSLAIARNRQINKANYYK